MALTNHTMIFKAKVFWVAVITGLFLVGLPLCAPAKTLYVDPGLGSDCPGNYNPSNRSCGSGSGIAYKALTSGLNNSQPGDTLLLRAGTFGQLAPPNSGSSGNPITIRAYGDEIPIIANLNSAVSITMDNKSYITIDGLAVSNVEGFGHIYDSDNIVIQNCSFVNSNSSGTTGSLKFVRSTYCKVLNNSFRNGGSDQLIFQDASDRNLIEGNLFDTAVHSLVSIRCSDYNVIRNNTFINPDQKAVEIYDCEGISDAPVRLDATKRNLFEENRFVLTAASDRNYRYNAMQHGGQQTIVRRNVFRNCLGGGVNYQYYSDESLYVYGNRLYNNTFFDNRCSAVIGNSGSSSQYYDNRVKNNMLYQNTDCGGTGGQVSINDSSTVILSDNALVTNNPGFADEAGNNFHLTETSPYIDSGAFVTKTAASGSGTALKVADATYFFDGFGIEGQIGDLIQLQGQTQQAHITNINYSTNTLTLDQPLTWSAAQGVHLAYSGDSPDMGAFEYVNNNGSVRPSPPKNLRVVE